MPLREPVIVHSRTHRAFAVLIWVLLAALCATLWLAGERTPEARAAVPTLVAVAIVAWAVLWQPSVRVDADGVTVRNILSTRRVSFDALIDVSTRWSVTLRTPRGAVSIFVGPQPSRLSAWGAERRIRREGTEDERARLQRVVHVGDVPGTESGDIAALVRDRWQQALDEGRVAVGDADDVAVPRIWHTATIAVLAVAIVAAPVAAWLIAGA